MTDTQANTPAGATVSFSEINEALQSGAEQNPVHARSLMATVVAIAATSDYPRHTRPCSISRRSVPSVRS